MKNWMLPVRAVQAVLSIVVLGLMAYGTHSPTPYPILRQSTLLCSSKISHHAYILSLCQSILLTIPTVSSWWATHWRQSSPIEINYLIFAPAWSLLVLAPLILTSLSKFAHVAEKGAVKWALLGVEAMTMLFWLSGFVALGVFLSGRICFGMVRVISTSYFTCQKLR